MKARNGRTAFAVVAGLVLALFAQSTPALASDVEVRNTQAAIRMATANSSALVSDHVGGEVSVKVPSNMADGLTLTKSTGDTLVMGLPRSATRDRSETGTKVAMGTTVYPSGGSSNVTVQTLQHGGVRALVTLKDASAPTQYRFPLTLPERAFLKEDAVGRIYIVQPNKAGEAIVIGTIATPWAKDAKGKPVETEYSIEGTTLVQKVAFDRSATFPVVADPELSFGLYIYVKYSKEEVKKNKGAMNAGLSAAVVVCVPFAELPWIAAACIAGLTTYFGSIKGVWNDAAKANGCVEFRYSYLPTGLLVGWRGYKC